MAAGTRSARARRAGHRPGSGRGMNGLRQQRQPDQTEDEQVVDAPDDPAQVTAPVVPV